MTDAPTEFTRKGHPKFRSCSNSLGCHTMDQEIRNSVVHRFEYTYELCHRMLRRQLQEMSATPTEVFALDYKSLIREGAKFKLIARPDAWFAYRRQRNLTSHI